MSDKEIVRVREVMNTDIDRVDGIMTVADALRNMKNPHTRALIVNKRNEDDEFGMVLLSDMARHVLAKNRSPERINVYEIMIKPVVTVSPNMDIRYCARLFDKMQISRTPVVENEDVIGIIGYTDIVLKGMCKYCE